MDWQEECWTQSGQWRALQEGRSWLCYSVSWKNLVLGLVG